MMQPYFQDEQTTIYLGDCREVLPTLGKVDLVLTDPPYGTGGWRRTVGHAGRDPSGSLVVEAWDDGAVDWLGMVPADVVMTFWPAAKTVALLNAANVAGLTKHRALYMRKRDPKPMVGGRTRWSVEPIWCLSKDGFVLHGGDDVLEASTPRLGRDSDATGHPYQKPLEVIHWLIEKTDAQTVLDPFAGSGTTARACKDLGRRCILIEQEERYCEIAARRLAQEVFAF